MNTKQRFFARPTTLGLALMNAAVKQASTPLAASVVNAISKDDDPKRPFKTGYNVPEVDRVHAPSLIHRMG